LSGESNDLERIVRLFQGPLAPISCATRTNPEACPMEIGCALRATWETVRDHTIQILHETNFADLAARSAGRWTATV
jgi:DNA-binding IscR family transcriptional regulator